jgi:hypothetical protein
MRRHELLRLISRFRSALSGPASTENAMLDTEQKTLFSTYDLKGLGLKNRVVMASMTRGRALSRCQSIGGTH